MLKNEQCTLAKKKSNTYPSPFWKVKKVIFKNWQNAIACTDFKTAYIFLLRIGILQLFGKYPYFKKCWKYCFYRADFWKNDTFLLRALILQLFCFVFANVFIGHIDIKCENSNSVTEWIFNRALIKTFLTKKIIYNVNIINKYKIYDFLRHL